MRLFNFLKKFKITALAILIAVGFFSMGSYDPYNELGTLIPNSVLATEFGSDSSSSGFFSGTSTFSVPNLSKPSLDLFNSESKFDSTKTTSQTSESKSYSSSSSGSQVMGTCKLNASAEQVFVGSDITLSWVTQGFSNITINGESVASGSGQKTFHNLQENTTYILVAKSADGKSSCTSTVKVVCLPNPSPAPTCNLTPSHKVISSGESVKLVWTTTNSDLATLTDYGVVDLNGSVVTEPILSNKTYELEVTGLKGEKISCFAKIEIKQTVPYCQLTLAKSVALENIKPGFEKNAKPGDILIYTINIKNTGTANCTGGGVKIVDELDPNISFISETHTSNLSAGYGSYPLYQESTRKLTWNGHDLTPGEEGTITWKGKINENIACGNEVVIKNKAKATAKELSNFSQWVYSNEVKTSVYEVCPVPVPKCEMFTVTPETIVRGHSAELTWKTSNDERVVINNGIGEVAGLGKLSVTPLQTTEYILTVFGENDQRATCKTVLTVNEPPVEPVPMCLTFSADPFTLPYGGGQSLLSWTTKDAAKVVIEGIGEVSASGTKSVSITETTTYTLTTSRGDKNHSCYVTIDVEPFVPLAPTCTLTPINKTIASGESIDLVWTTNNASSTTLTGFGNVALNGTKNSGAITADKTFVLNVIGVNGEAVSCQSDIKVSVTPPPPTPISCGNNVNLSANPTSVVKGNSSTITWVTNGVTTLSFDKGISSTNLSGSASVSPTANTTYTLTATDGKDTIKCPVTINITEPPKTTGGGGGSASPRCELDVSKTKIKKGEEVTLTWDSNFATSLKLEDSKGKVLVDTDDHLGKDKEEYFEGRLKVSPKTDTVYELLVERGSRDRVCKVEVEVEDYNEVVISEIRDQQPLIAGIALTDVPYTGFEAGPILTIMFYTLLAVWALYIAYLLVIRRDVIGGYELATPNNLNTSNFEEGSVEINNPVPYVASVQAPEADQSVSDVLTPNNLPIGRPVIGYASLVDGNTETEHNMVNDKTITEIENYAHTQHVLISSDAIRHFVATTNGVEDRLASLKSVIDSAKMQFPAEDGWIVINEKRMQDICTICEIKQISSSQPPYVPTVIPEGSGSLAEAIVTGNIRAAYELIGKRPMFALADAASDLDSVYRLRKGEKEIVSEMLIKETANLTDEQLLKAIEALTSALDGTYPDEASAVKISVMKAIKAVA